MKYNKNNPLRVFIAFAGYDSQSLALQRLKEDYPEFDFVRVGWAEFDPQSKKPIDEQPAVIANRALFPDGSRNYGDIEKPGVCEKCGATKNIDVHHIDGDWHNNNPKNLIILCRSCHSKLHHPKGKCYLCGKPVKGHGLCNMHYIRYKKYGDPLLYQGKIVGKYFTERKQ